MRFRIRFLSLALGGLALLAGPAFLRFDDEPPASELHRL